MATTTVQNFGIDVANGTSTIAPINFSGQIDTTTAATATATAATTPTGQDYGIDVAHGTSTITPMNFSGLTDTTAAATAKATDASSAIAPSTDDRVRLSALPDESVKAKVYGPNDPTQNVLAILYETGGLLFPYTPSISVSQDALYDPYDLVNTDYDVLSYNRTPSPVVTIAGKFTIQNQRQGEYAVAALHFLRTVSKMYFGNKDNANNLAGLPPPVLMLSGYGNLMFNQVRCVVKSHSYSLDDSVDMVTVKTRMGGVARLPVVFTLNVTVGIQNAPKRQREVFSLDDFRTGKLLTTSTGWI